jgi:hypothetical protein
LYITTSYKLKYELELFYRVIDGDLSPTHAQSNDFATHISFLSQRYRDCVRHIHVRFKKESARKYKLIDYQLFCFLKLNELRQQPKEPATENLLLLKRLTHQACAQLNIRQADITGSRIISSDVQTVLEIVVLLPFDMLSQEEAKFHYYNILLYEEMERIKRDLHREAYSLYTEKEIEQYIQNHQIALEALISLLLEKLGDAGKANLDVLSDDYSIDNIYKAIYQHLEEIARFIWKQFFRYIDIDLRIPHRNRELFSTEAAEKIQKIKSILFESGISARLIDITLLPLDTIFQLNSPDYLTYREITYANMYLSELHKQLIEINKPIGDQTIIQLLQQQNFNHPRFFNFCASQIVEEINNLDEDVDKLSRLYYFLKLYKQMQTCSDLAYSYKHVSIKAQMVKWIQEEIIYWQRKIKYTQKHTSSEIDTASEIKIHTSLPVSQISFFIRILCEINVLINSNKKDIFRVVARSVTALKKESISLKNLQNRFYEVEASTITAVRTIAQRIIDHIDKIH